MYHCKEAKPVWDTIDQWLERQEPVGGSRISEEAALLGVSTIDGKCEPLR